MKPPQQANPDTPNTGPRPIRARNFAKGQTLKDPQTPGCHITVTRVARDRSWIDVHCELPGGDIPPWNKRVKIGWPIYDRVLIIEHA